MLRARMNAPTDTLLHPIWLDELRGHWHGFNREHLGGRLQPPVLQIDGGDRRLGRWDREARILGIAHHHIWHHAWEEVLHTLKHEMAHQFADEQLGGDLQPHGPNFARACRLLGIDAHASGTPRAHTGDDHPDHRHLRKIQKLLALATSANRNEAATAMAAANTLLLRYNLERPTTTAADPSYRAVRLGTSAAAVPLDWKLVGAVLAEFFFVECIWLSTYNARRNRHERILEVMGSSANLEMAGYVHDFLHASVGRLWQQEQQRRNLPPSRRREYSAGVLLGFRDKLRDERQRNNEAGLVWLGDPDLQRFAQTRHPRARAMAKAGVRRSGAHEAGRAAGQRLTLQRPLHDHVNRGRALPSAE